MQVSRHLRLLSHIEGFRQGNQVLGNAFLPPGAPFQVSTPCHAVSRSRRVAMSFSCLGAQPTIVSFPC
jgi:hypothetical protein